MRYDILSERIAQKGYLKFSNRQKLHSHLYEYLYHEMLEVISNPKLQTKRQNVLFEIAITYGKIFVYTIYPLSKRVKAFYYTKEDNLEESLELLRQRLSEYGFEVRSEKINVRGSSFLKKLNVEFNENTKKE